MNELLGWYGYDKVDSRDTQGLNLNRFTSSNKDGGTHLGLNNNRTNVVVDTSVNGGCISGCGTENSSELDSPTDINCNNNNNGGGERESERQTSCSPSPPSLPLSSQNQASSNLPNGYVVCAWCQKVGMKLFTLRTNNGVKAFCSELCFTQCRRASFKKYKVCDWCKHIRHTVNYVDFQDGEQQLQFCSDKCLNQYKMNIFCRETQAHLQMHPHLRDASKLGAGACVSSSGSGGGSGSGNNGTSGSNALTLITPELWLRDCKGQESSSVNGHHNDDHLSGGESGDNKSDGGTSNSSSNNNSYNNMSSEIPKKIKGLLRNSHHEPEVTGGKNTCKDYHNDEKDSSLNSHHVGIHTRHSRLRDRMRKRHHRRQSSKGDGGGGHYSPPPPLPPPSSHHHQRHHHYIHHVLGKNDKSDKLKNNVSTHRCVPGSSTRTAVSVSSTNNNGFQCDNINSLPTSTTSSSFLPGGAPLSMPSLNVTQHGQSLPTSALPSHVSPGLPQPPQPGSNNDLLRPPVPVLSQQSLFLPQPPPPSQAASDLLRLPPLQPPPPTQGIRPQLPFSLPPGIQLPPSLQPLLPNLSHSLLPPPPPGGYLPTHPPPFANNPLSSLLPPVTVMVPYPVVLPVPIPIPIPIPLPIPVKGLELPSSSKDVARLPTSVASASSRADWSEDASRRTPKCTDDIPSQLQRALHQNPSKRVDSVITRLVNSKLPHMSSKTTSTPTFTPTATTTTTTTSATTSSMSSTPHGQPSSPSSSTSTVQVLARDGSPEEFAVNSSTLGCQKSPVKGGHRGSSVTPSEMDDRPSLTDTVHSLPGLNYLSHNVINNLTESADDDDSFGCCPDSDVDVDRGESDDSFNSTSCSQTGQEFEAPVGCDEFLNVPSSPTSRQRHYLVPMTDDGEPDMKRKCLRTRLLAK